MFLKNYKSTIVSACMGYVTQAILVNFAPLLFVTFRNDFGLSIGQVSFLILANFITELFIDAVASKYVSKIGYRKCVLFADFTAVLGLVFLAFLPEILPNKFLAFIICFVFFGIGGGLMEVLISPIVEACPTKNKSAVMSLLHSFYCWGQMGVIAISTVIFLTVGIEHWKWIAIIWAVVPLIDMILFTIVPINTLPEDAEQSGIGKMLKQKTFWIFLIIMLCAGASELTMGQWASAFAESGLGVEKWVGDLLGPCMFALCMASTRVIYAKNSEKINLENAMLISSLVCIASYLMAILAPIPLISLIGCAVCGIGCGILWPGSCSLCAKHFPFGGIAMFGFLALFGDIGCTTGPFISGQLSSLFGGNLKVGFAFALIFPIILAIMILLLKKSKKPAPQSSENTAQK